MKKVVEFEGNEEAVNTLDSLLTLLHYMSSWGCSRTISLVWDGDGTDRVKVNPTLGLRDDVEAAVKSGKSIRVTSEGIVVTTNN